MDHPTVGIYEAEAETWEATRKPLERALAQSFAAKVPAGVVADLGCGPGWYAADLPAPVVALDAAKAMLDRVTIHAPAALRVQGDLSALPLRRGALAGAWAHNTYVHLAREAVPLALADLHRALSLGAPVALTFLEGGGAGRELWADDDFPGRFFSQWERGHLLDVVVGAGFVIDEVLERTNRRGEVVLDVMAARARRLADTVGPGMGLLLVGLNPSLYAANAGVGFARPGNRFWPAIRAAGLVTRDRDPRHALRVHRIGMTDLVKRATVGAAELTADEYRDGLRRVERLAAW
ncbi:MAG: methyltransferase domain-containing protein, partial [Acidimicrobiales bacterium]